MHGLDTSQNFPFWPACFPQSLVLNLFFFEARAEIGRTYMFLCNEARSCASSVICFYVIYSFPDVFMQQSLGMFAMCQVLC